MSEWISVKDKLPERNGSYLVATKNGAVTVTHFYPNSGRFSSSRLEKHITHWQPLPAPPKMDGVGKQ